MSAIFVNVNKKLRDKLGLVIGTCDGRSGGLLSADPVAQRQGLSSIKKDLSAIAKHGGHTYFCVLGPDDRTQPRAKTFEIFKQVYPKVVAHAEKVGVQIAIEPWPGPSPGPCTGENRPPENR